MDQLPETILQFGSGKFLRGFADLFIHQANAAGQAVGRIVVVQTTGDERADQLNRQGGRYHVAVRGLSGGQVIDRVEDSASISRALVAGRQWADVLAVARSPQLRHIISNTAEAGYDLHAGDRPDDAPPRSFPAKLLLVLAARFEAGQPGVALLPCELFEENADKLRGLLIQLAQTWGMPAAFTDWLRDACRWHNALVDRIVTSQVVDRPEVAGDALAVLAEPYALWAVEAKGGAPHLFRHPALVVTEDVRPYFLRKVRILNAAHTALVSRAVPRGLATVGEAMADPEIAGWLERLLFDEIVPVLVSRVEKPEEFARQTLERFRNPFLAHKLRDILTYHEAKVKIRLVPTREEFVAKFGRAPARLDEAIAWQLPR
ncbi:MAG TPA: altronate dehydrogenase [Gemmataceae bacterium]|nr:altronate dehydrogenase [Gemmataceae bacterium]